MFPTIMFEVPSDAFFIPQYLKLGENKSCLIRFIIIFFYVGPSQESIFLTTLHGLYFSHQADMLPTELGLDLV